MATTPVPVERLKDVSADPENFMLLERVPPARKDAVFPMQLNEPIGDEQVMVLLDTETTGLNPATDPLIELGMVKVTYSPSAGRLTAIEATTSMLEDPGCEISQESFEVHGISQEDVAGKRIEDRDLLDWLNGHVLVVAHNAGFDRPVVEQRFGKGGVIADVVENLAWGCTNKEIDWRGMGFGGTKLEYLLFREGYFYAGHRADIDCLAMAWLLYLRPEALQQLLVSASKVTATVRAVGAPFGVKDELKANGYRWHGEMTGVGKHWWIEVPADELSQQIEFLNGLYPFAEEKMVVEYADARARYKAA